MSDYKITYNSRELEQTLLSTEDDGVVRNVEDGIVNTVGCGVI